MRSWAFVLALLALLFDLGASTLSCELTNRQRVYMLNQDEWWRIGPDPRALYHGLAMVEIEEKPSLLEGTNPPDPRNRVIHVLNDHLELCRVVLKDGGKKLQCAPYHAKRLQIMEGTSRYQYVPNASGWGGTMLDFEELQGPFADDDHILRLVLNTGRETLRLCNDLSSPPPPPIPCDDIQESDLYFYNQGQWRSVGSAAITKSDKTLNVPLVKVTSPLDRPESTDIKQRVVYLVARQVRTCRVSIDGHGDKALDCPVNGVPRLQFVYNGEKYQYVHDGQGWASTDQIQMQFTEVEDQYPRDSHAVRIELTTFKKTDVTVYTRQYKFCTDLSDPPEKALVPSQSIAQPTMDPRFHCYDIEHRGIYVLEYDWKQIRLFMKSRDGMDLLLNTVSSPIDHPEILEPLNRVIRIVGKFIQLCRVKDGWIDCIDYYYRYLQFEYDGGKYQYSPSEEGLPVDEDAHLHFLKVSGDYTPEQHSVRLIVNNRRTDHDGTKRLHRMCTDLRFPDEKVPATCPPPPPPPPTPKPCPPALPCDPINEPDLIFHNLEQWRVADQTLFLRDDHTLFFPLVSIKSPLEGSGAPNPNLRVIQMVGGRGVQLCRVGLDGYGRKMLQCSEERVPRLQLLYGGTRYERGSFVGSWAYPNNQMLLEFQRTQGEYPVEPYVVRVQLDIPKVGKIFVRQYKLCANVKFSCAAELPRLPAPKPVVCPVPEPVVCPTPEPVVCPAPQEPVICPTAGLDALQAFEPQPPQAQKQQQPPQAQKQQQPPQAQKQQQPPQQRQDATVCAPGGHVVFVLVAVLALVLFVSSTFCFCMFARALAHSRVEDCDEMPLPGFSRRVRKLGVRFRGSPKPQDTALTTVQPLMSQ